MKRLTARIRNTNKRRLAALSAAGITAIHQRPENRYWLPMRISVPSEG